MNLIVAISDFTIIEEQGFNQMDELIAIDSTTLTYADSLIRMGSASDNPSINSFVFDERKQEEFSLNYSLDYLKQITEGYKYFRSKTVGRVSQDGNRLESTLFSHMFFYKINDPEALISYCLTAPEDNIRYFGSALAKAEKKLNSNSGDI